MSRGEARKGKAAGNESRGQNHEGYKLAKYSTLIPDFRKIGAGGLAEGRME